MQIKYLKFMKKWLVSYKGRAIGIGETIPEALGKALSLIQSEKLNKYIWRTN